jgi:hypothetical protein
MKYYIVIEDLQGGEFGMGVNYTEEQWREKALEWAEMDENDGLVETLKNLSTDKIIPLIEDFWGLAFKELTEEENAIFTQAVKDHRELNNIVQTWSKSISDLYVYLKGHNLDNELFDCNYKSITATIYLKPYLHLSDYVDIWNDSKNYTIIENYPL